MQNDGSATLQSRFAAAGAGTLLTSAAVNPFDVVRVRMQKYSALEHMPAPQRCCKDAFWYPDATEPRAAAKIPKVGTLSVFRSIINVEGAHVLWRGVSLLLLQSLPANIIYFLSYEHARDHLASYPALDKVSPLLAGGAARALATTMVSPVELLKTRLQSLQVPKNTSAMRVAAGSVYSMVRHEGVRSLWSGLGLTLWRDVPFSSIYWLVVEFVRRERGADQSHSEKFAESVLAGISGGVVASVLTTPFDVAKTRRQLGHSLCSSANMSMPKFMACIAKAEGPGALFVGMWPRTMKIAPACAIMITSYEMGKRFLQ